jgi:hypothetical protein
VRTRYGQSKATSRNKLSHFTLFKDTHTHLNNSTLSGSLLLEHINLRQHGASFQVHRICPGKVGQPLTIQVTKETSHGKNSIQTTEDRVETYGWKTMATSRHGTTKYAAPKSLGICRLPNRSYFSSYVFLNNIIVAYNADAVDAKLRNSTKW